VEANDSPPYRHWHVVCAACGKIALARPCAPRREIAPVEHNPVVKCQHSYFNKSWPLPDIEKVEAAQQRNG
jgi:hypothetical protein